jgi:hypothetical protein
MAKLYDGKRLLRELRKKKEKEEWLFSIAVIKAGLEREGNLDAAAERELADALSQFDLTADELEDYLKKNRRKLLRFLDSSRTP